MSRYLEIVTLEMDIEIRTHGNGINLVITSQRPYPFDQPGIPCTINKLLVTKYQMNIYFICHYLSSAEQKM
jgi:hypothetical protein